MITWRRLRARAVALAIASLVVSAAKADDEIHGRIELQDIGSFNQPDSLDAALGTADHNDGLANARFTFDPSWGHWSLDVHYVVTAEAGEDVKLAGVSSSLVPAEPATWLDLSDTFVHSRAMIAQQGIDRLSLEYSEPDFVVRLGRQALTWGAGMVFRPMDLFDPFSPTATDTEFKPGTDMLYAQYLLGDGSDLQFIAVPRGDVPDGAPVADESSFALHYHGRIAGFETTGLIARDHGDWTGGFGVDGPLAGATWNAEIVPVAVRNGPTVVSTVANISDAMTLLDRNATVFAEYFHNGFGVDGDVTYATLPPDLKDRLARGQLFNIRRDYLAAGMTLEYSPLVTLSPTAIADLNDGSFYLLAAANWSLSDNLTLIAGALAPFGPRGSEFGGLPLASGNPVSLSPASQLYLQLRQYF